MSANEKFWVLFGISMLAPWVISLWSCNGQKSKFDNTNNYWCELDGLNLGDDLEED